MESKNYKNQSTQLEGVVRIPLKTHLMPCLENECVCRRLEHNFKVTRLIFGSILFTTHIAVLICILVTFGRENVCDDKIVNLQLDLQVMRTEYNSNLRIFKNKLKYLENLLTRNDQKLNNDTQENPVELPNFETLPSYTDEMENSQPESLPFNFSNNANMTGATDIDHEEIFENISRDIQNSTADPQASEFQRNEELCSQEMTSDAEDFPEYLRLCNQYVGGRRAKRSNMRGKQNGRKSTTRRRAHPNKRPNVRGPVASHFKGGVPETYIRDGGSLLAPWFHDDKATAAFTLNYEFREGKGTIEVTEEGLYLIYAQVYYLTTEPLNTYVINAREKDRPEKPIAYCSSNAVVPEGGVTEVSCYTAVIRYLNASSQVYITQRDKNRRMILRDGYSFMGLICLNSPEKPPRRRKNRN